MSDPLDDADRLADPPLLDSLHYEQAADGFSILFVPSSGDEPTRSVFILRDSVDGRQVSACLSRIQELIGDRLDRVVHRGGGDYTLRLAGGKVLSLSDESDRETWAPEVFDRLKQVAEVAEAFSILHSGQS